MLKVEQKNRNNSHVYFKNNMKICNQYYLLTHMIGEGNFGQVFLAITNDEGLREENDNKRQFAIKIERELPAQAVQLICEIQILKILTSDQNAYGFPQIYQHGMEKGNHYMVMDLLGPNLSDLLRLCGGKFSEITTIVLALQMFQRVEYVHSKGFLCRDIKPQNFLMGCGNNSSILFMIDFGLSKRYRDEQSGLHRPYKQNRDFNGTLRYASICSQLRIEQSRRDDLESLCYVIIYFLKGTLPWQNYNSNQASECRQKWILSKKMKTAPEVLCEGLPIEICNILQYCLDLQYYEDPDYNFIKTQLQEVYNSLINSGFNYDWETQSESKQIQNRQLVIKLKPFVNAEGEYSLEKNFMEDDDSSNSICD